VKTVILPKLNTKDIPQEVVGKMEIITVSTLEEVLEAAFPDFSLDSSSLSTTSNSLTRDLSKL